MSSDKIAIKIKPRERFLQRGIDIPGNIWQERPFSFRPEDFAVGGDRLHEKIFSGSVQEESLDRYLNNPRAPHTYGVSSSPSDMKAKYFAVFLVQHFLDKAPLNLTVRWESLYGNSFANPGLDAEPSLLVLTGLSPNSSNTKLEKARDLLEKHSNIPRIVVIAGEDPVTYFASRLYLPVNNIFFADSNLLKRKIEIT